MAVFTIIHHDEVDSSADAYWERTGISQSYDHLLLKAHHRLNGGSGTTELRMQLNGSTSYGDYTDTYLQANGTTVQGGQQTTGSGVPSFSSGYSPGNTMSPLNSFGLTEIWFPNYTTTTNWTVGIGTWTHDKALNKRFFAPLLSQQAALTAIKITPLSYSFIQYSTFTLIGVSCDV